MTPRGPEPPDTELDEDQAAPTVPGGPPAALEAEAERPSSYGNLAHVKILMERCIADAASDPARQERDQADMYNLRFYRGGAANQWIYRSRTSQQYEERPFDGDDGIPPWVPRCVTNHFSNRIDGIVSLLCQSDPAKVVTPATDDDEDVAAADVAQRGIPVIENELGWPAMKRAINHLASLTSRVAVCYYYDNDPKYGTDQLAAFLCEDCAQDPADEFGGLREPHELEEDGSCPVCHGVNVAPAMDPTMPGAPLTLEYPKGKLCADVVNSFGHSLPSGATSPDAQQNPWILFHNKWEVDKAAAAWPKHAKILREAGAGRASRLSPASSYADELRTLSSPTSARSTGAAGGSEKRAPLLIYRLHHDPIDDDQVHFPEGLYAVMFGTHVLEHGPLPVTDSRTGRKRKAVLTRTYRTMPGSPHGKPPADDMAPIQVDINLIKSLQFIATMMHASPQVFLPDTVTLIDELTGKPGQTTRFHSMDGSKPTLAQGSGVHASSFTILQGLVDDMDTISCLNAVLQGARPDKGGGNPTLGEVQILQERGMAAFKNPLDEAVDFEREQTILTLDIARQSMWSKRFRKILGDDGKWETEQFLGTDLTGNVDISIDPITAWPKSPMMQDLRTKEAVTLGILAPAQDPEVASKLLDVWGLQTLKPSITKDKKQIARELDRWRAASDPSQILPPNFAAIEVPLHLYAKKQFLKTEGAERLATENPPVYQAMLAHVQMLAAAMMPAPAPAEEGAGKDKGPDGSAVEDAVNSGALVPEGAAGDPLEAALAGGALQPEMPPAEGPSIDELVQSDLLVPAPQEAPEP